MLAGGQTLVAMLNLRLLEPALIIDINRIVELDAIRELDGELEVGAAVTQNRLLGWPALAPKLPLVAAYEKSLPASNSLIFSTIGARASGEQVRPSAMM